MDAPTPRFAVLVSGPSAAAVSRFLTRYVRPALGLHKTQWRIRYQDEYPLVTLSRPLRAGESAQALYGPYAASAGLILAGLSEGAPDSGREATRAWLKAARFAPVVELAVAPGGPECEAIDLGTEVVTFVNHHCPWHGNPVDDIDAYLAKNSKPFWA